MSSNKDCVSGKSCAQRGNALIIVLVVLIIGAVGVLAYMSAKMGSVGKKDGTVEEVAQAGQANGEDAGKDADPVIAKVDGAEVKRSEVLGMFNMLPPQMQQMPKEQLLAFVLEQMVSNKVIDAKASKANLDNDPVVLKQLSNAKEQIIRAVFLEKTVKESIKEEELKAKYDEYVKGFGKVEELKAAHILVEKEDQAKDIIKKLEDGMSFADLAKENSKDGTAQNGGDLGYFTKQDVVPEFADAAFATKVGEYTKKPVKTDFGYHVIKVEDKRERKPESFDKMKDYLQQEAGRETLDKLVKEWTKDAKIERFDFNGNPLPAGEEKQEPAAGEGAETPAATPAAAPEATAAEGNKEKKTAPAKAE